jgi:hypothetical protein
MTEKNYEIKDALVDWTLATGCIFLTDDEEGPCGVIASEDKQVLIRDEGDGLVIYYKGDEESLELLKDYLFKAEGRVKLFVDGYSFYLTID